MSNCFELHDGSLQCEQVSLTSCAREYGTPLYVYSRAAIVGALGQYQQALATRPHLICYAVKANSNIAVLQVLAQQGAGFDIVSGGELRRVLAAGGDPQKVVFSGVAKTAEEIATALNAGIRCFNVESASELETIATVAEQLGKVAPISIRVNPDVDAKTHPYISTGLRENKFGVDSDTALVMYREAAAHKSLQPVGIDCHIGSQITESAPFLEALDHLLALIDELKSQGIELEHLDLGGGLGVDYDAETPPQIADFIAAIEGRLGQRSLELVLEPGRSIVAHAGALLTRVAYLKSNEAQNFAIVDAAMNDLLRPSLYGAWQEIRAVQPRAGDASQWDIVGPVCETGDFLGKQRMLALQEGDLLAVMAAGAYGFTMASNYNSRPRPAEILIDGKAMHLVREREMVESLWAGEHLLGCAG